MLLPEAKSTSIETNSLAAILSGISGVQSKQMLRSGGLSSIFMDDPHGDAMAEGVRFLRIVAPFYLVVSAKLVTDGILRGSGQMRQFMVATFSDLILRVVLAKLLSGAMGSVGIWLAWPVGWIVGTGLSLMYYHKNAYVGNEKPVDKYR